MILVFVENNNGLVKKSSLEALSFGKQLASNLNLPFEAIVFQNDCSVEINKFGVDKINYIPTDAYLDSQQYTFGIAQIFNQKNAQYLLLSHNSLGKSIGGRLAVRLKCGLVSGVTDVVYNSATIRLSKNVYSGKAKAFYTYKENKGVISILPNAFAIDYGSSKNALVEKYELQFPENKVNLLSRNLIQGKVPLTEASIVVSAGRGLKDASNWGMIEDLAEILNATTACSRPVADSGWRPHHEHVGQTGIAIRPSVYIAIGISGAIQHLAGVNNSGTIVVINKDPEAPFFKAADYGVCGDLFEIVPKLNNALKLIKSKV